MLAALLLTVAVIVTPAAAPAAAPSKICTLKHAKAVHWVGCAKGIYLAPHARRPLVIVVPPK